jgi:hypothetical protein
MTQTTNLPPQQSNVEQTPNIGQEGPTVEVKGAPKVEELKTEVPESLVEAPKPKAKGKEITASAIIEKMGSICVRPYINAHVENMGLEDYGMVVFPGTGQEEQLAAIERNGVVRYVTGLDEFAPEVQLLPEEKKAAVILNIRTIVSHLEKQLATNVIEIDDKNFWDKVTLLKPNNQEFWGKITLRCDNEPLFFNPKEDAYDLIRIVAIEAGGFDLVAKSYDDAQTRMRPPKWYLDKEINTVATRTEYKKLRNKATSLLEKLFGKDTKKLMYIAKVLDGNSPRYKNSTPPDTLYEVLDEYIHANGVEQQKTKAATNFIKVAEQDMESLKLRALVKDATFYQQIVNKPDGMIYHAKTSAVMGRNVVDVVEYLRNPLHEDVLKDMLQEVGKYWNQ